MRRCIRAAVSGQSSISRHRSFLLPGKQVVREVFGQHEKAVNVLVTCTKRKTRPVPRSLRFGAVVGRTPEARIKDWIKRLSNQQFECVSAQDLYAGDQWQIAKSLPSVGEARGLRVQLWVCSAGYGLIPANAMVKPYSATFSSTHSDFVFRKRHAKTGLALSDWWEQLTTWEGPCPGMPRTVRALANQFPDSPLLIVASTVYLKALRLDVENALSSLSSPELLTVVSGGTDELGEISEHLLPCDARLQRVLGGARMSLNVRVAKRILARTPAWPFRHSSLVRTYQRLLAQQPAIKSYERQPITDKEVKRFIKMQIRANPKMRHSPMLRLLRDKGFACEQKRFRALFQAIDGNTNV